VPNLSVVPAHILLSNTDLVLSSALDHREARLKHELDKIKDHYDHIIIDCPPALSWLTINAFTAAERVVIVVSPGYFELDSVVQLANTMMMVQQEFNPELQLAGILFTMSDQTNNTETSLKLLRQAYPSQVFKTIIPRNVEIQHAHMDQKDIFAFNPNAKAAHAYDKLIAELIAL
jgi:chromosome partitioning protein